MKDADVRISGFGETSFAPRLNVYVLCTGKTSLRVDKSLWFLESGGISWGLFSVVWPLLLLSPQDDVRVFTGPEVVPAGELIGLAALVLAPATEKVPVKKCKI